MTNHTTQTSIRTASARWLSPTLFACIALAFLLPFATVSCDAASTTFTGLQLVTHTVPHGGNLASDNSADCKTYIGTCVERSASNIATVAIVAALLGLALGLFGLARGPGWCALAGLGALALLPFRGGIFGPDVYLHAGYDLAFWGFLTVGVIHIVKAVRRRRRKQPKKSGPALASGHMPKLSAASRHMLSSNAVRKVARKGLKAAALALIALFALVKSLIALAVLAFGSGWGLGVLVGFLAVAVGAVLAFRVPVRGGVLMILGAMLGSASDGASLGLGDWMTYTTTSDAIRMSLEESAIPITVGLAFLATGLWKRTGITKADRGPAAML
jgi:hypothetical protein